MSNAVFPSQIHGLTYTFLKTPEFSSLVQKSSNGATTRIGQQKNPIWHWELLFDYLYDTYNSPNNTKPYAPYTDLQTLMGFFTGRQGRYDDFLFLDPNDCWAGGAPNTQVSLNVFTDGTGGTGNYYSPLQRNLGGFLEDIIDLVPGSLQVWDGTTLLALNQDYTVGGPGLAIAGLSTIGAYIRWRTLPTAPKASFQFYFRVRFEEDTQDFEKWAAGLWTIGGSSSQNGNGYLKLMSARPMSALTASGIAGSWAPLPSKPIASATLNVTSAAPSSNTINPDAIVRWDSTAFASHVFDGASPFTLTTWSAVLSPIPASVPGHFAELGFYHSLTLSGYAAWLVYDINLHITFVDGSTATYRPATYSVSSGSFPTENDILNPANAIDGDLTTYATFETRQTNSVSDPPYLTVTW